MLLYTIYVFWPWFFHKCVCGCIFSPYGHLSPRTKSINPGCVPKFPPTHCQHSAMSLSCTASQYFRLQSSILKIAQRNHKFLHLLGSVGEPLGDPALISFFPRPLSIQQQRSDWLQFSLQHLSGARVTRQQTCSLRGERGPSEAV